MKKSRLSITDILSPEEIKESFKILAEDMIREEMELVKNEFPDLEDAELFDMVYDLTFCNYEYHAMNDIDKFDYLVDEILIKLGILTRA